MFWGPLAWTVIYGLIVATFLTLVIVPILFFITHKIKLKTQFWRGLTNTVNG
jgi:multidrug efflux pump